jgi:hypothetical protein
VIECSNGATGLLLDGEPPHTCVCHIGIGGWNPNRFRKIDAADDAFTTSIRRRQPVEA